MGTSTSAICFVNIWDHMGENIPNISSESTQQIYSPKFMYTHTDGLYQREISNFVSLAFLTFNNGEL